MAQGPESGRTVGKSEKDSLWGMGAETAPRVAAVAGLAYVLGFLISSIYALQFAVSPVDWPRPFCVMTGLPFVLMLYLTLLVSRHVCDAAPALDSGAQPRLRCLRTDKGRRRALIAVVVLLAVVIVSANFWNWGWWRGHADTALPRWIANVVLISLVAPVLLLLRGQQAHARWAMRTALVTIMFGGMCLYALWVYPAVPAALGGGAPVECDVLVDVSIYPPEYWDRFYAPAGSEGRVWKLPHAWLLWGAAVLHHSGRETVLRVGAGSPVTVPSSCILAIATPPEPEQKRRYHPLPRVATGGGQGDAVSP